MGDEDNKLTPIPKMSRTFYNTKANLDALTGLKDGEIAFGSDTTLLYRQSGVGAANWVAISSLGRGFVFGTYAGDNTDGRQITTGFTCGMVIVQGTYLTRRLTMFDGQSILDTEVSHNAVNIYGILHATDGFIVAESGVSINHTGSTYWYIAIEA